MDADRQRTEQEWARQQREEAERRRRQAAKDREQWVTERTKDINDLNDWWNKQTVRQQQSYFTNQTAQTAGTSGSGNGWWAVIFAFVFLLMIGASSNDRNGSPTSMPSSVSAPHSVDDGSRPLVAPGRSR
jgi:hypothetical protein